MPLDVPVAGVDRLSLSAPLAVQDLLAAARFAAQPLDDLNLASLLVSPLIGWSQDELYAAAFRRKGALWPHLRAQQPPERLAGLQSLLAMADYAPPHLFFETILSGPLDGRRRLLERLGRRGARPDRGIAVLGARIREQCRRLAAGLSRLVRARRCGDRARSLRAARTRCG